MNIKEARTLKSGDVVYGSKGAEGHGEGGRLVVKQPLSLSQSTRVQTNIRGTEFVWVGTSDGVWPSNRLKRVPWQ